MKNTATVGTKVALIRHASMGCYATYRYGEIVKVSPTGRIDIGYSEGIVRFNKDGQESTETWSFTFDVEAALKQERLNAKFKTLDAVTSKLMRSHDSKAIAAKIDTLKELIAASEAAIAELENK